MTTRLRRFLVLTTFLALVLGVSAITAPIGIPGNPTDTRVAGIDIDATTIPELQELMNARRLKSVQLTQFYLRRIRQLNPTLNAVITVSPTALADARAADAARRRGDRRPLLGIPIIVKDNINTTGMATTGGSWALAGSTPDDAFIVRQLEAAGALIIGKANLSEWANFRPPPRRAAGAGSAARRAWPTSSTAIPAARAPGRASSPPPTSQWPPSAPRPMDRSSAPRAPTRTRASSRRSGS
jgi:amidase